MKNQLLKFGILFGFALFVVACGNTEETTVETTEETTEQVEETTETMEMEATEEGSTEVQGEGAEGTEVQ